MRARAVLTCLCSMAVISCQANAGPTTIPTTPATTAVTATVTVSAPATAPAGPPRLPELEDALATPCPALGDLARLRDWFGTDWVQAPTAVEIDGSTFAQLPRPGVWRDTTIDTISPALPGHVYYELVPGVDIDVATLSDDDSPPAIHLSQERFDALQQYGQGRTLVLVVSPGEYFATAAVVDPEGAVVFQGACALLLDQDYADFLAAFPALASGGLETFERLFIPGSQEQIALQEWFAHR